MRLCYYSRGGKEQFLEMRAFLGVLFNCMYRGGMIPWSGLGYVRVENMCANTIERIASALLSLMLVLVGFSFQAENDV